MSESWVEKNHLKAIENGISHWCVMCDKPGDDNHLDSKDHIKWAEQRSAGKPEGETAQPEAGGTAVAKATSQRAVGQWRQNPLGPFIELPTEFPEGYRSKVVMWKIWLGTMGKDGVWVSDGDNKYWMYCKACNVFIFHDNHMTSRNHRQVMATDEMQRRYPDPLPPANLERVAADYLQEVKKAGANQSRRYLSRSDPCRVLRER